MSNELQQKPARGWERGKRVCREEGMHLPAPFLLMTVLRMAFPPVLAVVCSFYYKFIGTYANKSQRGLLVSRCWCPPRKTFSPAVWSFAFNWKVFANFIMLIWPVGRTHSQTDNVFVLAQHFCLPKVLRPLPLFVFQSQSVCLSFQFLVNKFPSLFRRAHLQTRTTKELESWQQCWRHLSSSNACVRLCLLCPHATASKNEGHLWALLFGLPWFCREAIFQHTAWKSRK